MSLPVADRTSNKNEQIEHAAEVIGRSKQRRSLFVEIYRGQKQTKTVEDLMKSTGLSRTRILDLGRELDENDLVVKEKQGRTTVFRKVRFFAHHRDAILRYLDNPEKLNNFPTKRRPQVAKAARQKLNLTLNLPIRKIKSEQLTVDDIDSFSRVRGVKSSSGYKKMPETKFRDGVARILGERDDLKDWGGELNDLYSARVRYKGQRRTAAIAFKGPGTTGKLTPGKMGKNGDQIQRLFKCQADIYIVQYWNGVAESVYEQLSKLAQLQSYYQERKIWFAVLDGEDSARLISTYPDQFSGSELGGGNGRLGKGRTTASH